MSQPFSEQKLPEPGSRTNKANTGSGQQSASDLEFIETIDVTGPKFPLDPEPTRADASWPIPGSAIPSVPGYDVTGILGQGGMGVVYQARHLALNRLVAVKMVRTGQNADLAELARFKSEAQAAARLQHPNIVQVFEVGEHAGLPFCALELVEGGSLAARLARGLPTPTAAADLVETLAHAMHFAHCRNVIHRDLKPANILVTAEGIPKVTDFGLARQLDVDSSQTQSGDIMGPPATWLPNWRAAKPAQRDRPPMSTRSAPSCMRC